MSANLLFRLIINNNTILEHKTDRTTTNLDTKLTKKEINISRFIKNTIDNYGTQNFNLRIRKSFLRIR